MCACDVNALSCELVRALRGKRSQTALSRRLGYSSNVLYNWEAGRRAPSAGELFKLAQATGVAPKAALARFLLDTPSWLDAAGPGRALASSLLRALRGDIRLAELAARTGYSRFALSRWLKDTAEPNLPEFLTLLEAISGRMLDFVACLTDPATLPAAAPSWALLQNRRRLGVEVPWSQAVLRALSSEGYAALTAHRPGWLAARLDITAEDEATSLHALEGAGVIAWNGLRYDVRSDLTIDVGALTRQERVALRAHWARVAVRAIERERPGLYSWNVFGVSRADFERLRELHLSYFRTLRAIVAESSPTECVILANVYMHELMQGDEDG